MTGDRGAARAEATSNGVTHEQARPQAPLAQGQRGQPRPQAQRLSRPETPNGAPERVETDSHRRPVLVHASGHAPGNTRWRTAAAYRCWRLTGAPAGGARVSRPSTSCQPGEDRLAASSSTPSARPCHAVHSHSRRSPRRRRAGHPLGMGDIAGTDHGEDELFDDIDYALHLARARRRMSQREFAAAGRHQQVSAGPAREGRGSRAPAGAAAGADRGRLPPGRDRRRSRRLGRGLRHLAVPRPAGRRFPAHHFARPRRARPAGSGSTSPAPTRPSRGADGTGFWGELSRRSADGSS